MAAPLGTWAAPIDSKVVAVHAHLLHTGKVLYFFGRATPVWARVYDPETNSVSLDLEVPNWPKEYVDEDPQKSVYIESSSIFCSGHCFLRDGRLLVAGGERPRPYPFQVPQISDPLYVNYASGDRGTFYTFYFDPDTETWAVASKPTTHVPYIMADGRWYPTLTPVGKTSSDAKRVLAISGWRKDLYVWEGDPVPELENNYYNKVNNDPELFDPAQGWSFFNPDPQGHSNYGKLPGQLSEIGYDITYPFVHLIPWGTYNGSHFIGAPASHCYIFNSQITPYTDPYTRVGDLSEFRFGAASVLFPLNSIAENVVVMIIGGIDESDEVLDSTVKIELNSSSPTWSGSETLNHARAHHNAVLLPDGKILVVGGNTISSGAGSVLIPEILDTRNLAAGWSDLPALHDGRNYHSTALLLPDGKVWVGGGRVANSGDPENDTTKTIEIFSPGYLMDGDRPEILDLSSNVVSYNERISFNTTMDLEYVVLMRPSSVTHGNDMEQRLIELVFTDESEAPNAISVSVTMPFDENVAPPGYYMLFALSAKDRSISGESNIPSLAQWIKIDV